MFKFLPNIMCNRSIMETVKLRFEEVYKGSVDICEDWSKDTVLMFGSEWSRADTGEELTHTLKSFKAAMLAEFPYGLWIYFEFMLYEDFPGFYEWLATAR